jgi:hypothetical protein
MRSHYVRLMMAAVLCLVVSGIAVGQAQKKAAEKKAAAPAKKYDPRDFTGFWEGPPPGERPAEEARPAFTAQGAELQKKRMPIYISKTERLKNVENPGCRHATCSNDPIHACNPVGFPRLVWEENEPIEFIHMQGRIFQLFQWGRTLRELWMDGRKLPSGQDLENLGPSWFGISVARWEGNTLVVETTGFDERMWPDEYAHPMSFDARIEERYTRVDADTIDGEMTIYDPKNYTGPWRYEVKTSTPFVRHFKRMDDKDVNFFGWKGLFSGITEASCAPMNEVGDFNKRIRDRAIFGDNVPNYQK